MSEPDAELLENQVIRRRPSVCADVYDDEVLLHDPASGLALSLSVSAGLVWAQCDGRSTTQDIVAALAAAYPEDSEQIRDDVPRVISELRSSGVLELS